MNPIRQMDPSVKKIINNGVLIAALAPLLGIAASDELADAAGAYRDILSGLGIKPPTGEFEECEQAQLLVKWIRYGDPDVELMQKWTVEIWVAIDDIAHGKLPT